MSLLPLTMGPLEAKGFVIRQSGVHWLCEVGHLCHPNEVIAYCNLSLERASRAAGAQPFADEVELQVAFAPRVAGRLRRADGTSPGGYLNHFGVRSWDADAVLGYLDLPPESPEPNEPNAGKLRLLMLAGRRMTGLADVHAGILPGWSCRSRAWWCDDEGRDLSTLLSLGICDQTGVILGDRSAFLQVFEMAPRAAQVVFVPDHPVVPCAPVLVEQFLRTSAQFQAIAVDLRRALADSSVVPKADDWIFAGALLSALESSPMRESYDVLMPTGLRRLGPADAILLSLHSEGQAILRHKKLGYTIHVLRHRLAAAGPAVRAWIAAAFEPVKRTIDDIRRDYLRLFDTTAATDARFLILNRMSTSGHEDIVSYAPFDHPMGETLDSILSKELNLMLHDIAAERPISIVDVDAIAADVGGAEHLPDGIHQSGALQAVLRAEILHSLQNFGPK
jgi:hypothetical protein